MLERLSNRGKPIEKREDHAQLRTRSKLRYSCLAILIPFYIVLCTALYVANFRQVRTAILYPFDDAYIHMALAKNLAAHGVFGVTADGFTACSSSPLWVFLTSGVYLLTGIHTWPPLALNFLFGVIFIILTSEILLRAGSSRWNTTFWVAGLSVFVPLPALVLSGMEHMLHILLSALLLFWAAALIAEPKVPAWIQIAIPITIAAAVMVRFETLFIVCAIGFLLLLRRRFLSVTVVVAAALTPLAILGLYSISKGWFWLPTSLLLKGRMPQFSSLKSVAASAGYTALGQLFGTRHILIAVVALVAVYLWRGTRRISPWDRGQIMICITFITILLHLQYATTGGLGRYEAYLLSMAIVSIGCADFSVFFQHLRLTFAKKIASQWLPWSVAFVLFLFPLFQHGLQIMMQVPGATRSVYRQQYQMARFLAAYYNESSLAANDIGAVTFFTRIRCLDLYGLANREVCRLKRTGRFDTRALDELARGEGTRIAIVYDSWFQNQMLNGYRSPRLPTSWLRVAEWKTEDPVFVGDATVTFYAVDPAEARRLRQTLSEFSVQLPSGTVQSFLNQ